MERITSSEDLKEIGLRIYRMGACSHRNLLVTENGRVCLNCKKEWEMKTCPKCNCITRVDVSLHVRFDKDLSAYRCKKCKHVWFSDCEK